MAAKLYMSLQEAAGGGAPQDAAILLRLLGTSPASATPLAVLQSLTSQLAGLAPGHSAAAADGSGGDRKETQQRPCHLTEQAAAKQFRAALAAAAAAAHKEAR